MEMGGIQPKGHVRGSVLYELNGRLALARQPVEEMAFGQYVKGCLAISRGNRTYLIVPQHLSLGIPKIWHIQ